MSERTTVTDFDQAVKNYIKAVGKGVLKVMSKMGISTVASLHRRPDLRGDRPGRRARRRVLHRHRQPPRRHRPRRGRRRGPAAATPPPTRCAPRSAPTATSTSAASTSGAVRASTTCSTPRRSSSSSTRPAAASTRSSRSTRSSSTTSRRRLATLRGLFALQRGPPADPDRRGRAGQRDRQALLHRRHELRLDLGGGARDARDRHEPPRRQVEHRRGRRGPGALRARWRTATRSARRSSRSPRAASA